MGNAKGTEALKVGGQRATSPSQCKSPQPSSHGGKKGENFFLALATEMWSI